MESLLLAWYSRVGRDLPWRHTQDPYAILVSEVMLQQTQVDRVIPRYLRFLGRWPTVAALAEASTADVIVEWQGLGYNRRAVNLQRAARVVAERGWPDDLTELPGVGRLHSCRSREFRLRRRRASGRHEHSSRPGADGRAVRRLVRPGPLRPRRDRVPRTRPTLRLLPARGGLPVAREPLRASSKAVRVRGLVPPAAGPGAARGRVGNGHG